LFGTRKAFNGVIEMKWELGYIRWVGDVRKTSWKQPLPHQKPREHSIFSLLVEIFYWTKAIMPTPQQEQVIGEAIGAQFIAGGLTQYLGGIVFG
jgi:hypothetical protein